MSDDRFEFLDGKLKLYLRPRSTVWQCSAIFNGKRLRESTGEDNLALARAKAQDWYLRHLGLAAVDKAEAGPKKNEKTFAAVAKVFEAEYGVITDGQRSPKWVRGHKDRLRLHLLPFFGELGISEVTAGKVQEYRVWRMTQLRDVTAPGEGGQGTTKIRKPPSRSTLHDEIVTLRLVLKTAIRHGWLAHLPDLSPPYKTQGKIAHRPWFSPEEYRQLYEATRDNAHELNGTFYEWDAEQLHDYVLYMSNTGLRPDEAQEDNLRHRDVTIITDPATSERILKIEVRGKRGVGYCLSTPGAVRPYERLRDRKLPPEKSQTRRARRERGEDLNKPVPTPPDRTPGPNDPVFPGNHIKMFNSLLARKNLKFDREGNARTAYSLRHTYICMRLMEGADIYAIAKNCRTSVEMIQKFYAAHIRTALDARVINVMQPKPRKSKPRKSTTRKGKGGDHAAAE